MEIVGIEAQVTDTKIPRLNGVNSIIEKKKAPDYIPEPRKLPFVFLRIAQLKLFPIFVL